MCTSVPEHWEVPGTGQRKWLWSWLKPGLVASAALCHVWAARNLGQDHMSLHSLPNHVATIPWGLTPACPGKLMKVRIETTDLPLLSSCPRAVWVGRASKSWGSFHSRWTPSILFLVQTSSLCKRILFSLMSYSSNPEVSLKWVNFGHTKPKTPESGFHFLIWGASSGGNEFHNPESGKG